MLCQSYGPTQHFAGGNTPSPIAPRTNAPPTGVAGSATSPHLVQSGFNPIGAIVPPSYTAILLHNFEQTYLNGVIDPDQLMWLKGLLDSVAPDPKTTPTSPLDIQFSAQQARLYALIKQISLNLDYFGQYENYVSLLSVKAISETIDALFSYGKDIEKAYLKYQQALTLDKTDGASLTTAQTAALVNANNLLPHLNQDITDQSALQDSIKLLLHELGEIWVQLFDAEAAFKNAIEHQGKGCSFTQIVTIAAVVASVVVTGGSAAAAIGPALAALQGMQQKDGKSVPVSDDFTGFKYEVTTVVQAGQDIQSFIDAFNKVKDAVTPETVANSVPPLPSDEAKIVASSDDIERQLQPFLSLPEAKQYQNLLKSFVATSESRNNKLLELQASFNDWDATSSQIKLIQAQAAALATNIADLYDPRLIPDIVFMENAYRQSQSSIAKKIYELIRAYEYYSLTKSGVVLNDFSVASLMSAYTSMIAQYAAARAAFGTGPIGFSDKIVTLSEITTKADIERFRSTGVLTFTVPDDHPAFVHIHHVLATRIWLELRTGKSKGKIMQLSCDFTHHGRAVMFDAVRTRQVFSHVAITIPYELRSDGHLVSTGAIVDPGNADRDYEGVSPYGPWTITVRGVPAASLASVKDILVHFDGSGRS